MGYLNKINSLKIMFVLAFALLTSGCNSGDGNNQDTSSDQLQQPIAEELAAPLEGVAVKGPLAYATVKIYKLDTSLRDFYNPALPLVTTTTDNLARFSGLRLPVNVPPPYVVVVDGSRSIDLDTNFIPVIPILHSIITAENIANNNVIIATPLTTLAFEMARRTQGAGASQAAFLSALNLATLRLRSTFAYGIDNSVDVFRWPAVPSSATRTNQALDQMAKHRAVIELFSAFVVQMATQNRTTTNQQIGMIADDLQSDGVLDDVASGKVMNTINLHTLVQSPQNVVIPNTAYRVGDIYRLLEYERRIVAPTMPVIPNKTIDLSRVALHSDMDQDGVLNAVDTNALVSDITATANRATKFNPGNYMLVFDGASTQAFAKVIGNPDMKGVQKRYFWNELETSKGRYDFSQIEADLYYLRNQGKRLVVQLQDKSFNGTPAYVPPYILQDQEYAGGVIKNDTKGWTLKKWNVGVQNRLSALYQVMGARFNHEPAFEALVFNETAQSLTCTEISKTDHLATDYRDGLMTLLTAAKQAFPQTSVIQYINYISCGNALLADVVAHAQRVGAGIGGPDITPDDAALARWAYPYYSQYAGRMILGAAVQDYTIAKPKSGMTLAETYLRFGKESLYLDYIFWNQTEPHYSGDVVPVLSRYRNTYR